MQVQRSQFERLEPRYLLSVIPVGPEFRVNTSTSLDEQNPCVAMDAEGNFVVAWDQEYHIYAQRYNAIGLPQGSEFRVSPVTPGGFSHENPALAMDADGDFVVAWQTRDGGTGPGIFAQRFSRAGVPQGDNFQVNTYTTSTQEFASVAMDADGDFVVAWQSEGQEGGSNTGVYGQRYNATGVPQGVEFRVNTFTPHSQRNASVAMDADGDFVVAWQSFEQEGGPGYAGDGVYAQRFNAAGAPQGGEFQVNTYTTDNQDVPSIAMDANGDFVVAWESHRDFNDGIYAQRFNANGVAQGGEFRVNAFTTFSQNNPSVAMDADGNFVVAWEGQDGSLGGITAQRFDAAGTAQGGQFRVNSYTTNEQESPSVAMDADGDFVIAWQSRYQEGPGSGLDIYAQRYAVVPEVTSSTFLFESSPHRLRFRFNHDVRDSLGTDDLLVENLTTGHIIPSDQFALLYDPASDVATFLYLGPGTDSVAGVVPDGRYRATLLADGIVTPQGAPPASDHVFDFFFLNGDANRDGQVDLRDFNILARYFGQSGTDFTRADFTYDGTTDLEDFDILAARFGQILPGTETDGPFGPTFNAEADKDPDLLEELA